MYFWGLVRKENPTISRNYLRRFHKGAKFSMKVFVTPRIHSDKSLHKLTVMRCPLPSPIAVPVLRLHLDLSRVHLRSFYRLF